MLEKARKINRESTQTIKTTAKEKIKRVREDNRVIALEVLQFVLMLMVFLGVIMLVIPSDPSIESFVREFFLNFNSEEQVNNFISLIQFPNNIVFFAVIVAVALWLYSYTANFRKERTTPKNKKLRALETIALFVILLILLLIATSFHFDPTKDIVLAPLGLLIVMLLIIPFIYLFLYIKEHNTISELLKRN
ncbi:MAG: hypothetical protein ABID38_05475 [Candidatus Diapherotrites archaeon]